LASPEDKQSLLDKLLDALDLKGTGKVTTKQLRMLERIIELQTESEAVKKYRIRMRFIRDIVIIALMVIFFIAIFVLSLYSLGTIHAVHSIADLVLTL
jgi:cell division protein FtsX